MPRGDKLTPEVLEVIAEVYLDRRNVDLSGKQIAYKVREHLGKEKSKNYTWPSDITVRERLRKIRARESEEDKPWSLGVSVQHNMPPEASHDLMKIRRWCEVVGMTFTIREALWVCYLRGVVPFERLYYTAILYARREQICGVLGLAEAGKDTSGMDWDTALTDWPPPLSPSDKRGFYSQSWLKGAAYRASVGSRWTVGIKSISTRNPIELTRLHECHGLDSPERELTVDEAIERMLGVEEEKRLTSLAPEADKADVAVIGRPASCAVEDILCLYFDDGVARHKKELTEAADTVYALYMRVLATGPRWQDLSRHAREQIANRLHAEVAAAEKEIIGRVETQAATSSPMSVWEWQPSQEIFDSVGLVRQDARSHRYSAVTFESYDPGYANDYVVLKFEQQQEKAETQNEGQSQEKGQA